MAKYMFKKISMKEQLDDLSNKLAKIKRLLSNGLISVSTKDLARKGVLKLEKQLPKIKSAKWVLVNDDSKEENIFIIPTDSTRALLESIIVNVEDYGNAYKKITYSNAKGDFLFALADELGEIFRIDIKNESELLKGYYDYSKFYKDPNKWKILNFDLYKGQFKNSDGGRIGFFEGDIESMEELGVLISARRFDSQVNLAHKNQFHPAGSFAPYYEFEFASCENNVHSSKVVRIMLNTLDYIIFRAVLSLIEDPNKPLTLRREETNDIYPYSFYCESKKLDFGIHYPLKRLENEKDVYYNVRWKMYLDNLKYRYGVI